MPKTERSEELAQASAARAHRDRRVGLMLIVGGAVFWVVAVAAVYIVGTTGADTTNLATVAGPIVVAITIAVVARGRRMRVGDAQRALAEDPRPPIVYLRPFDVDSQEVPTVWSSRIRISQWSGVEPSYEQRLARTLRPVGPFVAIGNPSEKLPQLGAARMYAADTDWQARVDELTAGASVLVLHVGESEGLAWEVHHVVGLGAPERLILSLPIQAKRKKPSRQVRYDAFRGRFGDVFPQPLPETIGYAQFAYFEPDWTPRLLTGPPPGDGAPAEALRRLARDFRVTYAPLWVRTTVNLVVFFAVLYGLAVLTGA